MNGGVSGSHERILGALAWYEAFGIMQPTRQQVGFASSYKARGGRFSNLIGEIKREGLIEVHAGRISLTAKGRSRAPELGLPTTNEALHKAVLERLTPSQAKLLGIILAYWPEPVERKWVAEKADYDAGGGRFSNLMGELSTLGLIEKPGQGLVRASDELFPAGRTW